VVWLDGKADDIVVVVMGPTGVGKSTFVKHLVNGKVDEAVSVTIGEDLESCTVNLQPIPIMKANVPISLEGRDSRLVIVDTPGFDDTYADDSEILKRIADWLASSYSKEMKLGGVIYLHDISQPRMLGTTRRNFEMFQVLCGNSAAKAMILGTTKWAAVQSDVAEKREKQLCDKFWGNVMMLGARTQRFENTSGSAWDMVKTLLDARNLAAETQILRIQEELVELEKIIPTTDAGKKLRYTLQEVLEMQTNSASQSGGRDHGAKMTEKLRQIENLVAQIEDLKVPIWHRLKNIFLRRDNIPKEDV
jgi:GTP-binding protein EngB required for normal cell division